jgi:hypothetical protein
MFINTQILNNNRSQESSNADQSMVLNSSGGFSTPTATHLSTSSDKTPSSSHRPSNNSVFLVGDDELLSQSANGLDIPNSSTSSSSASSPQQYSPVAVRTAPLYISVYTSTPPIPLVKGTVSSSAPPVPLSNGDELFFSRRSPSPQPSSVLKTNEQSNSTYKHPAISSSLYKNHHHPSN